MARVTLPWVSRRKVRASIERKPRFSGLLSVYDPLTRLATLESSETESDRPSSETSFNRLQGASSVKYGLLPSERTSAWMSDPMVQPFNEKVSSLVLVM